MTNFLRLSFLVFVTFFSKIVAQFPTFPDMITVYPDLDMISVEGFNGAGLAGDYIGRKLQTQVYRSINGISTLIGEAFPTVSGGAIAFEINHDFGYCWGAGSDYQVTPDIQPGDTIVLKSDGLQIASSYVLPVKITNKAINQHVVTLTGTGVNSLANPNFLSCRIVQPALVNTIIGRRDVRALPIIGNRADATGYTASITTNGDEFTCTFNFFDAANLPNPFIANSVYQGLMLVTSWIEADLAGNERGLTISEFEAISGPMNGACPPAPHKVLPMMGSTTGGAIVDNLNTIYWNPASDILGATHVLNYYSVDVLRRTTTSNSNIAIGSAVVPSSVQSVSNILPTNITLLPDDEILVRGWKDYPIEGVDALGVAARIQIPLVTGAIVEPVFSMPSGSATHQVSLITSPGSQTFYTITAGTVGVTPVLGADGTIIYETGKLIDIAGTQTIVATTIDRITGATFSSTGTFTNAIPLKAVEGVTAVTAGLGEIGVAWYPYKLAINEIVTGFHVYAFLDATSSPIFVGTANGVKSTFFEVNANVANQAGLQVGKSYFFKVAAVNNGIEGPINSFSVAPAVFFQGNDALTFTVAYNPGVELRIQGFGTIDNAVVTAIDPATQTVLGSTAITAGAFRLRIRPVVAGLNAITLKSSMGYIGENIPLV